MRKIFYLLLLVSYISFGQNIPKSNSFTSMFSGVNLNPISSQVNFIQKDIVWKSNFISAYNPVSNVNDSYLLVGNEYKPSTIQSVSKTNYDGPRVDSFNPSGTSDFGSALVMGALTFLFGKN